MKSKEIQVSIIIPVHNTDKYLHQCLNSVINQTLKDIEIICINDCSKDNSQNILKEFAQKDNRIKLINNKNSEGQSFSRNRGIEIARGKYIGFVDSDDFIEASMFEKLLDNAKANNSDIVMGKGLLFDEKTQTVKNDDCTELLCFQDNKFYTKPFCHKDTKDFFNEINVAVWNKLYKREFLISKGIKFSEGYIFEDLPFFFESYIAADRISLINDYIYFYRINIPSTMTKTDKKLTDRIDMMSKSYTILQRLPYFEELKAKITDWIIHDIFYRFQTINSQYQKEYFFSMQKLFRNLDISNIENTLIKTAYFPHFCEIRKKSYEEVMKFFINEESYFTAYVKRAQQEWENEISKLKQKQQEVEQIKNSEIEKFKKQEEDFQQEKNNVLENLKRCEKEFEQAKNNELENLKRREEEFEQAKNNELENLKRRKEEFEQAKNNELENLKRRKEEFQQTKNQELENIEKLKDELEQVKNKAFEEIEQQKTEIANKIEELNKKEIYIQQTENELREKYNKLFEKNKQQKKLNKIAYEKTKNTLTNKYIEELAAEKKHLVKNTKEEITKEQEYYQSLMKKQLELQKENYDKIVSFKNTLEEKLMTKPKVSIILPVYNVAPYLRESLDSIINQTLTDIEIICVNDGSTDESGKILDEYKEKDSRIKVLHKKNAGTGAARNDGLKMATGECIGFVDPDDWILPNMYERLYSILKEKNLDIVMFTPDVFNDQTKKHEGFLYFQDSNFPSFLDNKIFNKDDISPFSYPMCVWNKLYTKKLFDDNNIDFAEGLDFEDHKCIFKTLFTAKRIYFIREKLYVYRHSRQGSILSDNDTRMFDHIKIYDVVENILKETGNWEKFHLDFLRYKIHNILYYYTMIKPQYKKEYYNKMLKSIQATKMTKEEYTELIKNYPELKEIKEDTLSNKIKKAVNKIIK